MTAQPWMPLFGAGEWADRRPSYLHTPEQVTAQRAATLAASARYLASPPADAVQAVTRDPEYHGLLVDIGVAQTNLAHARTRQETDTCARALTDLYRRRGQLEHAICDRWRVLLSGCSSSPLSGGCPRCSPTSPASATPVCTP